MKRILSTVAIACSLFASTETFAQMKGSGQEAATNKGDMIFDFGVGVGGGAYDGYTYQNYNNNYNNYNNNGHYNGHNWGNNGYGNNKMEIPTLSVSLQKAFWDDITIGGQISFNAFGNVYDYQQSDGYYQHSKYTQTNSFITARGEYHFNRLIGLNPKCDLYAGVLAGARITLNKQSETYEGYDGRNGGSPWQTNYTNYSSSNVGPTGGVFGGFRYYFAKNVAVYGELGVGPAGSSVSSIRAGLAWRF
jgi:hypothetical protein